MAKNKSPCEGSYFCLLAAFVAGLVVFGAVNLTMSATDEVAFCASCHVMSEQTWTHQLSAHAGQACNECHTPKDGVVGQLAYKTKSGLQDVVVNTFMDVPSDIRAGKGMKDVIQANCVRCHYETVRQVNMTVKPYCVECHRAVPHLNKMPIDRRKAADV
ncbi:MAG: NapC/NirT family cytochrome c [Desulfovibrionaceae bacterium]|nr:NapC/NirT family cytochrome c [Desulfovibrionaceae bacterium]